MEVGVIGLGRMGGNIARRLARGGHRVIVYNRTSEKALALAEEENNIKAVATPEDLVGNLPAPRVVWIMLTAGDATEEMIRSLSEILSSDDTMIDGGNSNYRDTVRRAAEAARKGLHYVDAGTSGGIWGLREGYCLMIGGDERAVRPLRPLFEVLAPAPDRGWGHVGPSGAGHFVKMIHNGIEYALMEAYAEGFDIMKAGRDFSLDLHQIAEIWRFGSVIRSWLLDLIDEALSEDQNLTHIKGWVADSGEGRWTVAEALERDVPAPVITLSLLARIASRREESYAAKLVAAMRRGFGGHDVKGTGYE